MSDPIPYEKLKMPDYTKPPPHHQFMTIAEARKEHSKDAIFTADNGRWCKAFEVDDDHYCYVKRVQSGLPGVARYPFIVALDELNATPFVTREEACRMAWLSFLRFEYLTPNLTTQEIDRVVSRFQSEGRL